MVTKLYIVRHGETVGAETKRYKGHLDVPLSENGIRQMEAVARLLSAKEQKCKRAKVQEETSALTAVYCSDLSRAVKSAEIIAAPHGLKPVIVPELRERNFGIWEGMTFDEIKEAYPDKFNAWVNNPMKFSPMQGESTLEVRDRSVKALEKIMKAEDEIVAIVTHGGVIRILLCHFLGVPLENIFRIEQQFAAMNIIDFYDGYPVVKLINGEVNSGYSMQ